MTHPDIFFRQNEYDQVLNIYYKEFNALDRQTDLFFKDINSWDMFNMMTFNCKYSDTFIPRLSSFQNDSYLHSGYEDCGTFFVSPDVLYHFSIFQSEPFFYISIFIVGIFLFTLFLKSSLFKKIGGLLLLISVAINLYNYFIVEKDIISDTQELARTEGLENCFYISKFDSKYYELSKISPYERPSF